MLVAATVVSADHERLRRRWKLEGGVPPLAGQKVPPSAGRRSAQELEQLPTHWRKERYRLLADAETGCAVGDDPSYAGFVLVYDWQTRKEIWRSQWGSQIFTPSGLCFADGLMYVNDMEGAHIFAIDMQREPGRIVKRISHPYLNDLHSLARTRRGLLAASSGTDLVIEIDLEGRLLFEWWAAEHGYTMTPAGVERSSGRGNEHRDIYYHTRYQSTHVNTAAVRDASERYILALLFQQGQLVQIDRHADEQQNTEVILEGLLRPHTLEQIPGGWLISNSVGQELLVLDDALRIAGHIEYAGGWIQDCTRLPDGRILLNDVDQHQIVEFSGTPPAIAHVIPYGENWRMGELCMMPPAMEEAFLQTIRAHRA
ncbi:MAG TPA: hypothetical protein VME66_03205 [Candidatus Acidoferrales bacterium]|nr:hypothetical protein [Candidatus Acidoferrales bacterium]